MHSKSNHFDPDAPLEKAYKIQQAAVQLGFKWPNTNAIFDKLNEEMLELEAAIEKKDFINIKEEIGDLLFTIINFCCFLDINPSAALNDASEKFTHRFTQVKKIARKNNMNMALSSLAELQEIWQRAKQGET